MTREREEKRKAVNMAAQCWLTRLMRIKQKPMTRAIAERALRKALSAGRKSRWGCP
jgi:hypothetical protein